MGTTRNRKKSHSYSPNKNCNSLSSEDELKNKSTIPVNLDEIRKKNPNIDENLDKPTFLTKEQRQILALETRQKEVEKKKQEIEMVRKNRDSFFNKKPKEKNRKKHHSDEKRNEPEVSYAAVLDEKSLKAIKDRYFGTTKRKRRIRSHNERKFLFDWDGAEDTSRDYNEL
ncbi:hypothetical protein HZS_1105 [Henneguya salminicola]|nr:hypothetical protein HZS_1105 [Henneguya salminicola]